MSKTKKKNTTPKKEKESPSSPTTSVTKPLLEKDEKKELASSSSFEYEFGGPIGAFITTLALPIVVLFLNYWCDIGYININNWEDMKEFFSKELLLSSQTTTPMIQTYVKCFLGIVGWFFFQVLLERFLPCDLVQGLPIKIPTSTSNSNDDKTPTTRKLTYRINGHLAFWITWVFIIMGIPFFDETNKVWQIFVNGPMQLNQYIIPNFMILTIITIVLCFIFSLYLYLSSFTLDPATDYKSPKILAKGGNSGNPLYDYFMGRELNPRIGEKYDDDTSSSSNISTGVIGLDLKEFCELRPGLIGWMILNFSYAQQQYNELGYITGSMYLINLFQGIYVWDALYQERAILSTMDITTDGFGYMLVFGDLCWVPFTYSLQAKYLMKYDPKLSTIQLGIIFCIYIFGYVTFRLANGQKDAFRRNPNDPKLSHLKYLQTKRGTKLLISGWWGIARKINYTGDYIMALSWCLLCGFDSVIPYYYAIYFIILLIHRSIRDDHLCAEKYKDDWIKYKELVPYRFIPGIV